MKRKGTNIRMTVEVRNEIFNVARQSGRTLSEIVREAVEEWLKKREKRERSVK
ncbi:ribbon-helix-helix protein, CopG family [Thermodesulfovibrio yellowstonii]|uniref:CopG family transcriptional regulator n=1 Tax=Thermodesulfovibrio yellowstonii TaxID=28262 RepID=A0A9W6GH07_9BACT|nr:ribbon-helix-helix protein, CopG family [Thermodesulfovibrio islandicus]GLI53980.1 CopG family transcriptional regulator [Thermodesulfovibrio islandicus]